VGLPAWTIDTMRQTKPRPFNLMISGLTSYLKDNLGDPCQASD
jgi:hypothetical protein